ncbi:S9 family peptidase [Armatimonas rosea]|uniref:Dipeptidyl-peptidase-4 n=1 Tax=Armatimonas rosea TaxID=685828 RepID=A0A7W9SU18_ARMRO|nr:S9 family peptidase [Armatimonas rosea]MBB6052405.1 dipeptidyl-peptidase-4 [Armatimonas rosea]
MRASLLFAAALVCAAPAFAQTKVFTFDEALGGAGVSLSATPQGAVTWASGSVYKLSKDGVDRYIDARTGKEVPKPKDSTVEDTSRVTVAGRRGRRAVGTGLTSPDGRYTAFVKNNNLYVKDSQGGDDKQLTKDGSATILNGILDWVYDEEVYGRGSRYAIRWSPDSKHVAFLRLDESGVKKYRIQDHTKRQQDATEDWDYPLPGDPNPTAKLGIVSVDGGEPVFVDTRPFVAEDLLIVRFAFTPDGKRLYYQLQNRIQSQLELRSADALTGNDSRTLISEKSAQWIDVTDDPTWLADGTFLWTSDRDGFRHLYRYKQDGTLVAQVTKGAYDMKGVTRLDEAKGLVYFQGNGVDVSGSHLYRAPLDGKTPPQCLTQGMGTHAVSFSPTEEFYFDTYSTAENPGMVRLCDGKTGAVLKTVIKYDPPTAGAQYRLGTGKFVTIKARDGYVLEGTLLLPPGYDPKKRYPVYMPVYAGPSAPTARNSYGSVNGSVRDQFLAQNGIIVFKCDNRTANPRGTAAQKCSYKQFGVRELQDIEDALTYLVDQGYADKDRLSIEGWSFGGFMTAYALTHSKMFKCGIAGAPPTDWALYDTIYTERYMSTPQLNPDGYRAASCLEGAANCHGKLLLVHGMMDDNVHLQNSVQLIYQLQKAGKDFEMMYYPSPTSRHGIGDFAQSRHSRRLMLSFLLKNL